MTRKSIHSLQTDREVAIQTGVRMKIFSFTAWKIGRSTSICNRVVEVVSRCLICLLSAKISATISIICRSIDLLVPFEGIVVKLLREHQSSPSCA